MEHAITPPDIITFWYSDRVRPLHWRAEPAFDRELAETFGATHEAAIAGELDGWLATPDGALALVIVLDQLSRNLHRGTPRAFAADGLARRHLRHALARGLDKALLRDRRGFLYMPLMHSENPLDQARSVELFATLEEANTLRFAYLHKDIVDRFGRFPHRNAILGRINTPEETEFLTQPGSGF
ncbi:MAG: DUF924 family protein [Nannocystaceae bacterium]|nr:DUF924 domain-containing protein [Myxococcales bacterium]